jgi:DNA-directed RNA polymerase specialized sigma24 family protein
MTTTGRPDGDADRNGGDPIPLVALMRGYCRGERDAFDQLYSRVAPSLFAELVALCGDARRSEALLERTFLVLHECRSSYVEGADPLPWIFLIARRELVLDGHKGSREARRPLWSRVRTFVTRTAEVGLEAQS